MHFLSTYKHISLSPSLSLSLYIFTQIASHDRQGGGVMGGGVGFYLLPGAVLKPGLVQHRSADARVREGVAMQPFNLDSQRHLC